MSYLPAVLSLLNRVLKFKFSLYYHQTHPCRRFLGKEECGVEKKGAPLMCGTSYSAKKPPKSTSTADPKRWIEESQLGGAVPFL